MNAPSAHTVPYATAILRLGGIRRYWKPVREKHGKVNSKYEIASCIVGDKTAKEILEDCDKKLDRKRLFDQYPCRSNFTVDSE